MGLAFVPARAWWALAWRQLGDFGLQPQHHLFLVLRLRVVFAQVVSQLGQFPLGFYPLLEFLLELGVTHGLDLGLGFGLGLRHLRRHERQGPGPQARIRCEDLNVVRHPIRPLIVDAAGGETSQKHGKGEKRGSAHGVH